MARSPKTSIENLTRVVMKYGEQGASSVARGDERKREASEGKKGFGRRSKKLKRTINSPAPCYFA